MKAKILKVNKISPNMADIKIHAEAIDWGLLNKSQEIELIPDMGDRTAREAIPVSCSIVVNGPRVTQMANDPEFEKLVLQKIWDAWLDELKKEDVAKLEATQDKDNDTYTFKLSVNVLKDRSNPEMEALKEAFIKFMEDITDDAKGMAVGEEKDSEGDS